MGKVKYSPEMKEQTVKYVPEGNKSVMHTVAALPSYKKATNPYNKKESFYYTVHNSAPWEVGANIKGKVGNLNCSDLYIIIAVMYDYFIKSQSAKQL